MPYRDQARVQAWVDDFHADHDLGTAVSVLEKDFTSGPDSGIVVVTLRTASTVTYIQAVVKDDAPRWIVSFEPRHEGFDLDTVGVMQLANDLMTLANLCTYLQARTDEVIALAQNSIAQNS